MPKLHLDRVPKYRRHQRDNLAVVRIQGRDSYLGSYGSPESHERYNRLIAEWLGNGRQLVQNEPDDLPLTVAELIVAYHRHAHQYYRRPDGTVTDEARMIDAALSHVRRLYGRCAAEDFSPRKLKAVRQSMIEAGWSRNHINKQVGRVVRMFRWAAEEELVSGAVRQSLAAVAGLRKGRSEARESAPVRPVDDETVNRTLEWAPPIVADMAAFQRLTGCRPDEVCSLRPCDVDRSGDVWRYRPQSHKTQHRGRERVIFVGPRAQAILRPYLLRDAAASCFSPEETKRKLMARRHEQRKTPLEYGNRPGSNRKPAPRVKPGSRYTIDSYRRAIQRACDKAGLPRWSPNRLRHSAATEIRKRYGLEGAQVALGHARADVTQVYAERDFAKPAAIMAEVG